MNKVNKHAHTHRHIEESENLKKGSGGSMSRFRSSTFLTCFITSALYIIFRTVMTKRISTPQVNGRGTYILLD